MGYYVHFQISWGGGEKERVVEIAKNHLDRIAGDEEIQNEVKWFLDSVISGKSFFGGPKGDFWSWGIIGNYTNAETLIDALLPFFKDLYQNGELLEHDQIIAFCEPEQSENVDIYQIDNTLTVQKFDSDGKWFWGQW